MRIVLEHVNSDYVDCASRLLDKVPLRKKISEVHYAYDDAEGSEAKQTDLNDAHDRSFSDDWLPE